MAGVLAHPHDMFQVGACVGQGAAVRRRVAQCLRQFARQTHQALQQGLVPPRDQRIDLRAPAGFVAMFDRPQRGADAPGDLLPVVAGDVGRSCRIAHAAFSSRSKILPSLSLSVVAVNGLMT